MKNVLKYSLINAITTSLYVILIATFLSLLEHTSLANKPDTFIAPIFMLLLFVFSAALTGVLVFGRPIIWYLEGKKKESIYLLSYTLGFILLIIIVSFILILLFSL